MSNIIAPLAVVAQDAVMEVGILIGKLAVLNADAKIGNAAGRRHFSYVLG